MKKNSKWTTHVLIVLLLSWQVDFVVRIVSLLSWQVDFVHRNNFILKGCASERNRHSWWATVSIHYDIFLFIVCDQYRTKLFCYEQTRWLTCSLLSIGVNPASWFGRQTLLFSWVRKGLYLLSTTRLYSYVNQNVPSVGTT